MQDHIAKYLKGIGNRDGLNTSIEFFSPHPISDRKWPITEKRLPTPDL